LLVKNLSRVRLASNTNWFCGGEGRRLSFNGVRMTLGRWRALSGEDGGSISSPSASFAADFEVTSTNLGARRGQPLGLEREFLGTKVPAGTPDIGAYETRR